MPTYLYACEANDNKEFEEYHSINDVLEECPVCKEKGMPQHKPKRLIAGPGAKGIVELKGKEVLNQYNNDMKDMQRRVDINNRADAKRK